MINSFSNTVMGSAIGVGQSPFGVAVSPVSDYVFVTNYDSNTVSVINSITHTVSATIGVGSNPWGVAVDPGTGAVYVANMFSNTVSVISA